jgi:hypothetical protein
MVLNESETLRSRVLGALATDCFVKHKGLLNRDEAISSKESEVVDGDSIVSIVLS